MTATPTVLVETTSTSIPTSIPPTATIEPSPTVDPNMPKGATGKDANGNYTKMENGVTVTWNAELNTWERSITNNNGVPLLVNNAAMRSNGLSDTQFLHVLIDNQLAGVDDVASLSLVSGADESAGKSFAGVFHLAIQKKFGVIDFHQLPSLSFTTITQSLVYHFRRIPIMGWYFG